MQLKSYVRWALLACAALVAAATMTLSDPCAAQALGTWVRQESLTAATLLSVDFVTRDTGFAVGTNTILRTNDGGISWIDVTPDRTVQYRAVDFVDEAHGWVLGYGGVARTSDGGATWSWSEVDPSQAYVPQAICFVSRSVGYAVNARGGVYRTTDGGVTWTAKYLDGGTYTNDLRSVKFANPEVGWTVGSSGLIFKTVDGGESWVRQWLPDLGNGVAASHLNVLSVVDSETVQILASDSGWDSYSHRTFVTSDGGNTWAFRPVAAGPVGQDVPWSPAYSMAFGDSAHGWICGGSVILGTSDGGESWDLPYVNTYPSLGLMDVASVDATHAWAVGGNGLILRYVPEEGTQEDPYVTPSAEESAQGDKPVIVFVGGLDSRCTDSNSDKLFGWLRSKLEGDYTVVIAPSQPGSGQQAVIDSTDDPVDCAVRLDRYLYLRGLAGRKVILVGHSMGGLISRAYAGTWEDSLSRCEPLAVIQLGTPNAGSPLAALKVLWDGPLFSSDAVLALASGRTYIKDFNHHLENSEQIPFFQVAGTFFPWDADYMEGGSLGELVADQPAKYARDAVAAALNTAFLLADHDGAVSRKSAFSNPTRGVEEFLSVSAIHTLGNSNFRKFTRAADVVPHHTTGTEGEIYRFVRLAITRAAVRAEMASGGTAVSNARAVARGQSTLTESVDSTQERWKFALSRPLTVSDAATTTVPVTIEGTSAIVAYSLPDSVSNISIQSVSGSRVSMVSKVGDESRTELVAAVDPGHYEIAVRARPGVDSTSGVLSVIDGGPTTLSVDAPSSVRVGGAVTVSAYLRSGESSVTGATLEIVGGQGEAASMKDDGVAPDAAAGDGLYTSALSPPYQQQLETLEVRARGTTPRGAEFARYAMVGIEVVDPCAALAREYASRVTKGASGKVTTLTVDSRVTASRDCTVSVILSLDADNGQLVSQPRRTFSLMAGETTTLSVPVSGDNLSRVRYDDIRLRDVDLVDETDGAIVVDADTPGRSLRLAWHDVQRSSSTLGLVQGSPTNEQTSTLIGTAVSDEYPVQGVSLSFDHGQSWYPVPAPSAGWGSGESTWTCAVTLPEGEYSARARAVGATSTIGGLEQSIDFIVDRTAPVLQDNAVSRYAPKGAAVSIVASDGLSQVGQISYRVDGGQVQTVDTFGTTVTVTQPGPHTLEYWAVDAAGNASTRSTRVFEVAEILPKVRLTRTTSWATLGTNWTYHAKGYVAPRQSSSSPKVYIYAYKRRSNGAYFKTPTKVFSVGSTYVSGDATRSLYRVPVRFSRSMRGTWRIRAYRRGDSFNAATYGDWDYIKVK